MDSFTTDDSDDTLLSLSFNQDGGCLAVGTAKGFRICNVSPFQETHRRTFATAQCRASASDLTPSDAENEVTDSSSRQGGGVGKIEMLFRCNLYALVGGGTYPQYPPNRCIIWDDHCGRDAGYLIFRQRVLTVRLRRDRICIALRDKVYVYNFANLGEVLDTITTGGEKNGAGLLCISTEALDNSSSLNSGSSDDAMVLACPSVKRGQVRVELYGNRKTVLIDAHEGPLAAIALTVDGSLLATASERGTLIRLFDTGKNASDKKLAVSPTGNPLREFRRGIEQAKIGCLCFSMDKCWLGCTSDRGTVHVFRVKEEEERNNDEKSRSSSRRGGEGEVTTSTASKLTRSFLPRVLTKSSKKFILEGEHSYARVRGISHPQACAFVPDKQNTIAVAGLDDYGNGCLLLASFGPEDESGEDDSQKNLCKTKCSVRRVAYHRFFKNSASRDGKKEDWDIGKGGRSGSDEILYISEIDDKLDHIDEKNSKIMIGDNDADGFVSVSHEDPKKVSEVSKLALHQYEMNNRETHTVCDDEI